MWVWVWVCHSESVVVISSTHSRPQSVFSSEPSEWTVIAAPEPRDVHWDNCRMPHASRDIRTRLFDFATFMLVLFWTIPVTFVASLTTLQNLSARLPFLEPVVDADPALRGASSCLRARARVCVCVCVCVCVFGTFLSTTSAPL